MEENSDNGALARAWRLLIIGLLLVIGLCLIAGGSYLAYLGGSGYYLATGLALVICGALLLRRSNRLAVYIYSTVLVLTVFWSFYEVRFDWWAIVPRLDILFFGAIFMLAPVISRRARAPLWVAIAVSSAYGMIAFPQDPHVISGDLASAKPLGQLQLDGIESQPDGDWRAYGRSNLGNRFSPLTEITPDNVSNLKVAWQIHTDDPVLPTDPKDATFEDTPLKVGNTLYICTSHQQLLAIDAADGKTLWRFNPEVVGNKTFQHMTCRGVSYHETPANALDSQGNPAPSTCQQAVYLPTNTAKMYALDAKTGARCPSFGANGEIDLNEGMLLKTPGFYEPTSPAVATEKILVVNGAVTDNYSNTEPSGVVRGFDIYTGKLVWAFDSAAKDVNHALTPGYHYTPSSPNSWAPMAYDQKAQLVYLPMGMGTPDVWGGTRTPEAERYSSAIVALNISTGHVAWSYQTVHHDLWDMDVPAQPTMVDLRRNGAVVPALLAPTKSGDIFVLNRLTGELVVPAPETPVSQNGAAGEHLSPTQPFSDLTFRPMENLKGSDMWGASMLDQLACRIEFKSLRYDGPFTPPSEQGTLIFPGNIGMFEWGGVAVDPERQILVANSIYMPFFTRLLPRGPDNPPYPSPLHPPGPEGGLQPMLGTPYAVEHGPLFSPLMLPCVRPPWGYISAVDLNTMKTVWKYRNGTIQDNSPIPLPIPLGVPSQGGPLITRGGVMFLTSTLDLYIRAYSVNNGKLLWQNRLPAGGQSTPMTYSVNGKQYVLTTAGGHGPMGTKQGDSVIAYALN